MGDFGRDCVYVHGFMSSFMGYVHVQTVHVCVILNLFYTSVAWSPFPFCSMRPLSLFSWETRVPSLQKALTFPEFRTCKCKEM